MDTMNTNEIITTEAINTIKEAIPTNGSGLKNVGKTLAIVSTGIAAWELLVKPIARKIKTAVSRKKHTKTNEVAQDKSDINLDNEDLSDVLEGEVKN